MTIKVLLFGPQADLASTRELVVDVSDTPNAREVLAAVGDASETLRPSLAVSRLAVNHAFADDETTVNESDEVALIGMVSGG